MNVLDFSVVVFFGSIAAGFLGALTGLGGGVIITPFLTLIFHVDIRYAIGASLISVIATSSGAAAAYVRGGFTNLRVGMLLQVATVFGAIYGAYLAAQFSSSVLAIVFGLVLAFSAYLTNCPRDPHVDDGPTDASAVRLKLDNAYPAEDGLHKYYVHNVAGGCSVMVAAGVISGLLGIGSGSLKVLAMDQVMRMPFKVATTTSNLMIGVTAAASAGIYLTRGYIDAGLVMPVVLGVLIGSYAGAKVLIGAKAKTLRRVFSIVIFVLALQMIYKGLQGKI
jgi:uncharacterized membrane protein YfcA